MIASYLGYKRLTVSGCKNDILSGLTVALALVPEAVAFALVAGVSPMVGLYAAFIMCLASAILGGRPGIISGATGSTAAVMITLVAQHGIQYLFAAVILMGLIQVVVGVLKLGKFIRMMPQSVIMGFVNGLAIVIFIAQLQQFGVHGQPGWLSNTIFAGSVIDIAWLKGSALWIMLMLVAIGMLIIYILPKITKAVPAPLAAIMVVTIIVYAFNIHSETVGDIVHMAGSLPSFHLPSVPLNLETLKIIFPYSIIMAAVGIIESLLTLRVIDEYTETRGKSNRECVGQGMGNLICGVFGGMGGCAMIGQSMINVSSGGRSRLSGIMAGLSLLFFILVASSLIEKIPVAALVSVMFMVVIGTFEWNSFRVLHKIPKSDALVLILVSVVTVFTDLAFAVFVGVIISAVVFAWKHAGHIQVRRNETATSTIYHVSGPLYFTSTTQFLEEFTLEQDKTDVIVDFAYAKVCDHSGLEAIDSLAQRYLKLNKTLHFQHLSPDCKKLLHNAKDMVEINILEDPNYQVKLK